MSPRNWVLKRVLLKCREQAWAALWFSFEVVVLLSFPHKKSWLQEGRVSLGQAVLQQTEGIELVIKMWCLSGTLVGWAWVYERCLVKIRLLFFFLDILFCCLHTRGFVRQKQAWACVCHAYWMWPTSSYRTLKHLQLWRLLCYRGSAVLEELLKRWRCRGVKASSIFLLVCSSKASHLSESFWQAFQSVLLKKTEGIM